MSFYVGILGEIILISLFVLIIWFQVLLQAIKNRGEVTGTASLIAQKRLLLTSVGLVINSFAIVGLVSLRIYELSHGIWALFPIVSIFFALLGVGNFLFIISASVGSSSRMLKLFLITSAIWIATVTVMNMGWI